jgi:hypothetical protein
VSCPCPTPSTPAFKFARCPLLALLAFALLAAGCSDNPDEQVVQFQTHPPGATVKIDGTPVGHTPMSAVLGSHTDTHISLEKPGFVTAEINIHPASGELSPNPVISDLRPELIPDTPGPGPNPQAALANSIDVLHQYIAMGRISPDDEAYITYCLKQYYTPAPASH